MVKKNTIRVTYAFDRQTVAAVDQLAAEWGVSKSEATRRAVRMARKRVDTEFARLTPAEAIDYCAKNPTRSNKAAAAWQRELRALRKSWGPT